MLHFKMKKTKPLHEILPATEGWITGRGLSFQEKLEDQDYTALPRDITKVASHQIGQMLSCFSQQCSFIATEVSRVDVGHTLASKEMDLYEKRFLFTAEGTQIDKKAKLENDDTYITLSRIKLEWYAKLTMLKGMLKAAEQNYTAASREISRREADIERHAREGNLR